MQTFIFCGSVIAVAWALAYFCAPALWWTVVAGAGLLALYVTGCAQPVVLALACIIFAILALLFNPGPIRRALLGNPLLVLFRKILPHMSSTEKEALDAGTVWWDGDLFSGKPNWKKLHRLRRKPSNIPSLLGIRSKLVMGQGRRDRQGGRHSSGDKVVESRFFCRGSPLWRTA